MSGFVSIPLAISLAVIAVVLLGWSSWPFIKRIRFQTPLRIVLLKLEKEQQSSVTHQLETEVSLACHIWKNVYLFQYGNSKKLKSGKYLDVWENMLVSDKPAYSEEEYQKYIPLFGAVIDQVINKLSDLLKLFGESIEQQFKMRIYKTIDGLKIERQMYAQTPYFVLLTDDKQQAFDMRFSEVIRCLSSLDREADKMREANKK